MAELPEPGWVLGIDSGGSGIRLAIAPADGSRPALTTASPSPAITGERGIDADSLLARVLPAAEKLLGEAGTDAVATACLGAAGMATLGDDLRDRLPAALASALGVRQLALAADGVTAFMGALGQRPGAVVAGGTGLIALGTGLDSGGWRRADGWGHLLGDCGGGAWIGRAGLEVAMRAHDGRRGGSAPLLARLNSLFGPATQLPGQLYPRPDRPAVLASFAPEVARLASTDPVAAAILDEAAEHIAATAAAACPAVEGSAVALTGGLFKMGEPLLAPLRAQLAAALPQARLLPAAGDPLDGALGIAQALAKGALRLPRDQGGLLHIAEP